MKTIITSLFVFVSSIIYAQVITYEETANIENQLQKIPDAATRERVAAQLSQPTYYELYHRNGKSLYKKKKEQPSKKDTNTLNLNDHGMQVEVISIETNNEGLYIDNHTHQIVEGTSVFGKPFLIKDQLPKIEWKLSDETKQIENFHCKKATAQFDGQEITAWYSEEIPLPLGPRYYRGLPGLIISLSNDNQNYKAISIHKLDDTIEIPIPSKGETTTLEAYKKIVDEKINAIQQQGSFSL